MIAGKMKVYSNQIEEKQRELSLWFSWLEKSVKAICH